MWIHPRRMGAASCSTSLQTSSQTGLDSRLLNPALCASDLKDVLGPYHHAEDLRDTHCGKPGGLNDYRIQVQIAVAFSESRLKTCYECKKSRQSGGHAST